MNSQMSDMYKLIFYPAEFQMLQSGGLFKVYELSALCEAVSLVLITNSSEMWIDEGGKMFHQYILV